MQAANNTIKARERSREAVLISPDFADILEDLAKKKRIAPEELFHGMVEKTLACPADQAGFREFLRSSWNNSKSHASHPLGGLRIGALTASLLLYLSYRIGMESRTNEAAEHLISFYARVESRATVH
ncbi:hypothetical protein BDD14_6615 [Edaphobacter modestus]|uniref:Uncharacterized protein n=1 Tax=Edaphobacter modestus TaxID=388466 RepID=A0A4Q7XZN7_9BACT|nr:hypothetical protein BDD14_6615 [Edaphobacter modestus]